MKPRILHFVLALSFALASCAGLTSPTEAETTALDQAQQTLIDFFDLLVAGNYERAAALHVDDADFYDTLRQNNPEVDPSDHAALLQAACTFQLRCMRILRVVSRQGLGANQFQFVVEFANLDGSLFVLGPCCGADETSMPPVSQFEFLVENDGGFYLVLSSPIYVP